MAKFTSQEVSALQEGGNQRAREIYFKEWDQQHQSLSDSSNVDRLRNLIKHVYVDRKFTGERAYDKPPRVKAGDKDDLYENRRMGTYQRGSKSPQYEDTYERRYSDRSSPGGRSPGGISLGGRSPSGTSPGGTSPSGRSPGGRSPDKFKDGRKFEDRRIFDGDIKMDNQSPERAKDLGSSSLRVVRPVRDILGENVRTSSSSSLASSNGNLAEVKLETTKSLIDFDDDPEPPVAPQPVVMLENFGDNNWASFDFALEEKAAQGSSNANPLEPVLSQLSIPAALPGHVSGAPGGPHHAAAIPMSSVPVTGSALIAAGAPTISSLSAFQPSGASVTYPGSVTVSPLNNAGQLAGLQYQQPSFPGTVSQPTIQQFTPPVGGAPNNQPWNIPSVLTVQGHASTPMPHAFHHANETNSNVVSQPSTVDIKPNGRTELPEAQTLAPAVAPGIFILLTFPQSVILVEVHFLYICILNCRVKFSGAYMGQQMPTNTSMPRYQGIESFGADGAAFGISNPDQQLNGRLSIPATPNPFPARGNPFG
ncbi:hypothetical protein TanjilG_09143 [Lupinus angustifolius]|uniref:Arf-GAP domain-containing protein n=1 Tax=Lupinus angustifolius TaxID=3871 RepID=A0A1J7I1P1_LUPAN|nr:hypothetical protein TanjilG_09143 [Lupinus angustifolius]